MKKTVALFPFLILAASCSGNAPVSSISSTPISSPEKEIVKPEYSIPEDGTFASKNANGAEFDVNSVEQVANHPLKDRVIYWLGSSVTYGSASSGSSMADYLAAKTGCKSVKEAVSGTTLLNDGLTADTGAKSYVNRLKTSTNFNKTEQVDAFICQISTNDCTSARLSKRGEITADDVYELDQFDVATTLGAVEYIIEYVIETYDCPIYFYSGAYFTDGSNKAARQNSNPKGSDYATLIEQVKQIAKKWDATIGIDVGVIDLFNDQEFNEMASDQYYAWATSGPIHPKKAGYIQWWTPYFEARLINDLA